jgi:cell division protein FtsB
MVSFMSSGGTGKDAVPRLPRLSLARMVILLAAVAVGYFVFNAGKDTLLSHHLTQEEQQLHQQIDRLQSDKARLAALRDYLKTDEYVEGVARRLGLVRPGESLVIVSSTAPATPAPTPGGVASTKPWWEQLFGPE